MNERITISLGPLVGLATLEERLGPGTPEGERHFWDCGCAARFDAGEGAWRYAFACSDHTTEDA